MFSRGPTFTMHLKRLEGGGGFRGVGGKRCKNRTEYFAPGNNAINRGFRLIVRPQPAPRRKIGGKKFPSNQREKEREKENGEIAMLNVKHVRVAY